MAAPARRSGSLRAQLRPALAPAHRLPRRAVLGVHRGVHGVRPDGAGGLVALSAETPPERPGQRGPGLVELAQSVAVQCGVTRATGPRPAAGLSEVRGTARARTAG